MPGEGSWERPTWPSRGAGSWEEQSMSLRRNCQGKEPAANNRSGRPERTSTLGRVESLKAWGRGPRSDLARGGGQERAWVKDPATSSVAPARCAMGGRGSPGKRRHGQTPSCDRPATPSEDAGPWRGHTDILGLLRCLPATGQPVPSRQHAARPRPRECLELNTTRLEELRAGLAASWSELHAPEPARGQHPLASPSVPRKDRGASARLHSTARHREGLERAQNRVLGVVTGLKRVVCEEGLAEEQKRIEESYLCAHSDRGGEGDTEPDPECCPATEQGDGNNRHTGNPT